MNWRYIILSILICLTLSSCNNDRPGRTAPWATGTNQFLLGDPNTGEAPSFDIGTSPENALLVIEDMMCGSSPANAYLFTVSWVTTIEDVDAVRIEYEVVTESGGVGALTMTDPEIAEEFKEAMRAGATAIAVPESKITGSGDKLLARVVVNYAAVEELISPTDIYMVKELCHPSGE